MGYKPEMGICLVENDERFNIYYMEKELDKLDSYLKEHYLDIEDNVYLFFNWLLEESRDAIVKMKIEDLALYQYNNYLQCMGLEDKPEIRDEFKQIWESIHKRYMTTPVFIVWFKKLLEENEKFS
jgi:hypothetical protein